MFQVEAILWLQDHGGQAWQTAMVVVSMLGLSPAYAAFAIVAAFFVRMRAAVVLVIMLLSTALLVDCAKNSLALPRPDVVDARVMGEQSAVVERGGASELWALPPPQTVEAVRERATPDWGFPSGHVASATTFAFGVRVLLPWRGAGWFAAAWIPLMALSRLSLGRHFIGDVLGGFAIGFAVFAIGRRSLAWIEANPASARRMLALLPAAAAAVLGMAWVSELVNPRYLGTLAGMLLVAWVLTTTGWPPRTSQSWQRVARCTAALALHGAGTLALTYFSPAPGMWALASAAITMTALLLPTRAWARPSMC